MIALDGIFGVPHGILSSHDEWIALAIGLIALIVSVVYDGELDLTPVRGAAIIGVITALVGSYAAPPRVTNEWHVSVFVVLVIIVGVVLVHRRR